jgi:hypothetical protein
LPSIPLAYEVCMADAETVHKARKNGGILGKYGDRTNTDEIVDMDPG